MSGTLYIVATPIGNLEDITLRALRILKEVDLIAAEDTRHTRKLLTHFGISRPLTSYFDHNKEVKGNFILDQLEKGTNVALVTDAGTPCVSDPGYQIVRDARAAGLSVIPIPGACAAIAALSASGLPSDLFTFAGFLSNRQGRRKEKLQQLSAETGLLIFYEAPKRLLTTLRDMLEVLGDREVVIARELTKIYEEFLRGRLSALIAQAEENKIRGEVAILVAPADEPELPDTPQMEELLSRYLQSGEFSLKDAVKKVTQETGMPKSVVYAEALRQKG
ncbi:16S rRNA (cytidine(1402)-2'-O)-methyltransferase [Geomonas sp.]|jgi:16S rRNA (cytidine1402-2'-O)-methyltransferase|uniref:16S rRNA (cytidine(1402)-2'-O)-methyltransferase n=1 Tax=Geomonas sp. TaxID=2651584 RepID=UPI002B48896B|nr:16S rRNA (cytidine(1402)-2'-O)-methyltransferase [Geomonas sp.]HJV35718.1 16S rRNA (cytidine(1402)-2'-O)-methyltransferase [Geomonas sp.]